MLSWLKAHNMLLWHETLTDMLSWHETDMLSWYEILTDMLSWHKTLTDMLP